MLLLTVTLFVNQQQNAETLAEGMQQLNELGLKLRAQSEHVVDCNGGDVGVVSLVTDIKQQQQQ